MSHSILSSSTKKRKLAKVNFGMRDSELDLIFREEPKPNTSTQRRVFGIEGIEQVMFGRAWAPPFMLLTTKECDKERVSSTRSYIDRKDNRISHVSRLTEILLRETSLATLTQSLE
jgi:hypothetical protein